MACAPLRGGLLSAVLASPATRLDHGVARSWLARPAAAADSARGRSRFVPFLAPAARPSSVGCLCRPLF